MAKMVKCEICGKEISGGFFGDIMDLNFDYHTVKCCEDCYNIYKSALSKKMKKRIAAKIYNFKKLNGAVDPRAVVQLLKDTKERVELSKTQLSDVRFTHYIGNLSCSDDGYFIVKEHKLGEYEYKFSADSKVNFKNMELFAATPYVDNEIIFSKDEISKICYYEKSFLSFSKGTFSSTYCKQYEIMLNDGKEMSVKPCIVEMSVVARAATIFHSSKAIEAEFLRKIFAFQNALGINVPVEKVKSFK